MSKIIRAPLFWFLVTGSLFFVVDHFIKEQLVDDNSIIITDGDLQRIRDQWNAQSGTTLSNQLLKGLLEEDIQERRLFKEALALGLDKDDVIIKRRLVQKLRFLTEDLITFEIPENNVLEDYFEKNKESYKRPPMVSFHHVYFSSQSRGKSALKDALKLHSTYKSQIPADVNWQRLGDPFMLGQSINNRSIKELSTQFGSEYTNQLVLLREKEWSKPIQSLFGYHLVWLDKRPSSTAVTFTEIRLRLIEDYQTMQKQQAFQEYIKMLKEKYPLVFHLDDNDISSIMALSTENEI